MSEIVSSAFRQALNEADGARLLGIWGHVFPDLPQPRDKEAAEVILHKARTEAESVRLEARLYSHAWLTERMHKSGLPDDLRPPGERVSPLIVRSVGVAVKTTSSFPDRIEEAKAVEKVMAAAAGEMVRRGIYDRATIAPVMWQKRREFLTGKLKREF